MVSQVRTSVNIAPIRASQPWLRSVYIGRRGMRTPSSASMMRPSTSDSTRTDPRNSNSTGMPMIRISSDTDSDSPVTTQVKKNTPVTSDSSM